MATPKNIGELIIEASQKPIRFEVSIEDKKFELFFHPPGQDEHFRYAEYVEKCPKDQKNNAFVSFYGSACLKDKDGNNVFETIEQINKVKGKTYIIIRDFLMDNLIANRGKEIEAAIKNLQGSLS